MDATAEKLIRMLERTPVLVAAYDEFDRLRFANQAFRSTYFLDAGEEPLWADLMRRNHQAQRGTVIRHPDFDAWLISTQSRRGKIGFRAFETDLIGGRWLWMTETVQGDGWMLCIANDITHLRAAGRTVRQDLDLAIRASHTDELTGIANRRYVMARLDEMLAQPAGDDGLLGCVCVLDLDNFKYVNDQFGHQAGDAILRDFAACIQRHVRRSDCFGRVGGEEFMLLLPETPAQQAALIVERMLAAIRRSRPLQDRGDFSYSFSAGIAAAYRGNTPAELFARADRALYLAKIAGRNRIQLDAA